MSATWVTFVFEAANFLVLAALLGWLFFRPVRDALERRRRELEDERLAARAAREEAERERREAQARRSEIEGSLEQLRLRAQHEAEEEKQRLLEAAREKTQRERDLQKDELAALRRAQARSLARDAAAAAREIVVRLLEEVGGPELEKSLLEAACRELELLRASGPLAPITIESARELDATAVASLAQAAQVGPTEATRRLDPDLVAGLRVLTARGLVDLSARGLSSQAERALRSRLEEEDADHG